MKRFECTVPWLDGRPLINATALTEKESAILVDRLNLSDDQILRVEYRNAELAVSEPEAVEHG